MYFYCTNIHMCVLLVAEQKIGRPADCMDCQNMCTFAVRCMYVYLNCYCIYTLTIDTYTCVYLCTTCGEAIDWAACRLYELPKYVHFYCTTCTCVLENLLYLYIHIFVLLVAEQ